jgi:hypothetical protein
MSGSNGPDVCGVNQSIPSPVLSSISPNHLLALPTVASSFGFPNIHNTASSLLSMNSQLYFQWQDDFSNQGCEFNTSYSSNEDSSSSSSLATPCIQGISAPCSDNMNITLLKCIFQDIYLEV